MNVTSSYAAEILCNIKCFIDTILLYRQAVKKLIQIINQEWENIKHLKGKAAQREVEILVHGSKSTPAKYKFFDKEFLNFPSYLRRAAITEAFGCVSSFRSNLAEWEKSDKKKKKPHLKQNRRCMPVFYKDNMFQMLEGNKVRVKVLIAKNTWDWREFSLDVSDLKYITDRYDILTTDAPRLEKKRNKVYLRFSFTEEIEITKEKKTIIAVDLGINHDAVYSIMREDGTVIKRGFIDFFRDKGCVYRILDQISQAQRNGAKKPHKLWRFAKNYNAELSKKISSAIAKIAIENNVDVIVLEHLDSNMGKIHGPNKKKLHMWRKRDITKRVTHLAHKSGLSFSTVNPRNTSNLAFDGSGKVKRDKSNYSLCTFKTGKVYNADLNASYNIGARYFIRNILGSLSEKQRLLAEAKVPSVSKRIDCTLSTLSTLYAVVSG